MRRRQAIPLLLGGLLLVVGVAHADQATVPVSDEEVLHGDPDAPIFVA